MEKVIVWALWYSVVLYLIDVSNAKVNWSLIVLKPTIREDALKVKHQDKNTTL